MNFTVITSKKVFSKVKVVRVIMSGFCKKNLRAIGAIE